MKVALFLEGSPGHEKQSLAIIQGLRRLTDVEVAEFILPERTKLQRLLDTIRLFLTGGNCRIENDGFDLAIGTGSKTHATLVACKNKLGVPIVTCMTPDKLYRRKFDLCFVPRHDQLEEKENIFLTDGPPVFLAEKRISREPDKGLILVGGIDESSHYWRGGELSGFIRHIADESSGMEWSISSSPRTPDDTVQILEAYAKQQDHVTFYNFKDTPRGWVEEQYARSTLAWVTADSVSMIYEALTAGCKVGILPVRWKDPRNKFQRSIDLLLLKGLVKIYSPATSNSLAAIPDQVFNEADRCARKVIDFLAPEG